MNKGPITNLENNALIDNVKAQCLLADKYLLQGSRISKQIANILLLLASKNGDCWAQYSLGYSFQKGDGVRKNLNQAIYWYSKSAE